MRTLVLLILVVALAGCSSTASKLRGSWVMVDYQGQELDPQSPPGPHDRVKTLSDTHFAFGWLTEEGEVFGGGGTWSAKDGIYVEQVRYHSHPQLRDQRIEFQCRLEGDLWYHEAQFEARGRRYDIREVWKRLASAEN